MASFDDLIDMVDATAQALLGGELIVEAATLTKVTPGTRTPGSLGAGTNPTRVAHECEGIVKAFNAALIDGTIIKRDDRRISLFCSTLPDGVEPKSNDEVTIDGVAYIVLAVLERDPARFMFTVHGRK
jgi:hypothetical protein